VWPGAGRDLLPTVLSPLTGAPWERAKVDPGATAAHTVGANYRCGGGRGRALDGRRRRTVLAALALVPLHRAQAATAVGPKAYYLALGDWLAFGYQPNLDSSHGYANAFYTDLHARGTSQLVNIGCPGETSVTFTNGGCSYWRMRKTYYSGSQLNAAVNFISSHTGKVSPVTLDIGANDLLPEIDGCTCAIASNWSTVLSTFDTNFRPVLQQLQTALGGKGDPVVVDY
jgi:lysophospholipase L1-like esterase